MKNNPLSLLLVATAALRDLHAGYPEDEIAAIGGTGLERLLPELTGYLRGLGINDDGALSCDVTDDIPVATHATPEALLSALLELKTHGLMFPACVEAFANPTDLPYVEAARKLLDGGEDHVMDGGPVVTSRGETGAFVMTWVWVSDDEAGVQANADLLETILDFARKTLEAQPLAKILPMDEATLRLRNVQADWLEDLITNFADELDDIEHEVPKGAPGSITWLDEDEEAHTFMPSDALFQLVLLAKQQADLPLATANEADEFCRRWGNKLDALLTVFQTAGLES